ncbi:hypothetical protein HBI68_098290 [Parastagonospora nodorum]|nr:hypothetical protein HBI68_098290 [Parastagonospora nodorum]
MRSRPSPSPTLLYEPASAETYVRQGLLEQALSLPPPSTSAATVWKAGVSDDSTGTERGSLNSLNSKRGIRTINRRAPQAMKPGYRSSPENTGAMKATVVDE